MLLSVRTAPLYILLLTLPYMAAAQTAQHDDHINNILTETSIQEQIEEITSEVKEEIKANPFNMPKQQMDRTLSRFEQAYNADQLMKQVQQTFNEEFEQSPAEATLQWLNEDKTQIILNEKNRFYSLQGKRERIVRRYELEQDSLSSKRKNIIHNLIEAQSAKESELQSRTIIFRSILSAFNKISNRGLPDSSIDEIVQNFKKQIEPQMEQEVFERLSIMYYTIDDQSLANYRSFYQSKPGQWLSATTSKAIHQALQSAADEFNQSLTDTE